MAWAWACRSREPLSRRMADRSAPRPIPLAGPSFVLPCAPSIRRTCAMSSDKETVHVIDDDEAARQSLAFLLGTAGFKVQTHDSAGAFLDLAPDAEAGCVITDVRM